MPTKTDRILSYLPTTFRTQPRGQTLYSVVDPFGKELQDGENSLAAVMQSHWVDFADLQAEAINDLAKFAALYGLAPRDDETVEEFREHLKRYVCTFLEGTVTVQGILRITAEALGLHIADDYAEMDSWWTREDEAIIRMEPDGKDATESLFGVRAATHNGRSATAAYLQGTVDLSGTVDCRENNILRVEVDESGPFEVDLAANAADSETVSGEEIAQAINDEVGQTVAHFDGRFLSLTSPQRGSQSRIEVQDVLNDAADKVLGLPPRAYYGRDEKAAAVRGTVDLSGVLDLSKSRYLRLLIDGQHLAEIDCAGSDAAHTLLDQVVLAINGALGFELVTHDGRFLSLNSPTAGLGSSIVFQRAAAQQALARLFGPISNSHRGRGPQPARVTGRQDLSLGVDLSQQANIQLRVDGVSTVMINCAGEDPANTQLPELVAIINEGVGSQLATHNGRFLTLTSTSSGTASEILFQTPDEGDATELILGIGLRTFKGGAATAARLIGTPDLTNGVDLRARRWLRLSVDGRTPITIDLRPTQGDVSGVTLQQLADTIDAAIGADVAAHDGQHLILVTPTSGSGSSLRLEPITTQLEERFVTRAIVTDEAALPIFGFIQHAASGQEASNARIMGQVDLQRGVDLRQNRYLRLRLDNYSAVEIDCAGPRPRATLLAEVLDKINETLQQMLNIPYKVASDNGRRLILSSQSAGQNSQIIFEPPRVRDALALLLDVELGEVRGRDAEQIRFVGTADLSQGVDLSGGDRIKIGLDGAAAVEIACADNALDLSQVKLNEIMIAINLALGSNVVTHDGAFLRITSPTVGAGSQIVFEQPAADEATLAIFGIEAPRSYSGSDAVAAKVVGRQDLSSGVDLRVIRFLRLGVDGQAPMDVDCVPPTPGDETAVTLDEIIAAINAVFDAPIAGNDGDFLTLTSPTVGQAGRIVVEAHSSGDALEALLGDVTAVTTGQDLLPATLIGEADLLAPANLSQRSQISLSVDGGLPVDIDVVGAAPQATALDEIIKAINDVFPDLASPTDASRLKLTSPTAGGQSQLTLLPLRTLDVIEYPSQLVQLVNRAVRHNDSWHSDNTGAAAVFTTVTLTAPQGVSGPTLVNETIGWQLRLFTALGGSETVRLWAEAGRLRAEINSPDGTKRPLPASKMMVGPLGTQAWVPFEGSWQLSGDEAGPPSMQLNNPLADNIIQLQARQGIELGQAIGVTVTESAIKLVVLNPVADDGKVVTVNGRIQAIISENSTHYQLLDADDDVLARLRAGSGINLNDYEDRVVTVSGTIHPDNSDGSPLLIAQELMALFQVTLTYAPEAGESEPETYTGVTIGHDSAAANSLSRQIQKRPSSLVVVESLSKVTILELAQGRTRWRYLDCYGPRFNFANFNEVRFPGNICLDRGVFNVSRFANSPPEMITAVFASTSPITDPTVGVRFEAVRHQPGAFRVHLPADLPDRFGGRFNQARMGQGLAKPELYEQAVTEPAQDDKHIKEQLNRESHLVEASIVPRVPLGWEAISMPFRQPHHLTGGDEKTAAQIYLAEEGIDGFLRIYADEVGAWGNHIAVAARASGPAMYDFSVIYEGVPFENGRKVVAGKPLAKLAEESLKPGPVGILMAKAAGVRAEVSRDRISSKRLETGD
ncbi:hypothetical protein MNBD_CHLOROFLEXI01-3942 [hydrothermal vent metagenome]|uniref:Uncharacterized protein n=1 Tax=hydrothermal vent metagenome TaxID=652676 RepID=A0A3B0VEJ7_9ZZZZ